MISWIVVEWLGQDEDFGLGRSVGLVRCCVFS